MTGFFWLLLAFFAIEGLLHVKIYHKTSKNYFKKLL